MKQRLEVRIADLPHVLWEMRRELAAILRDHARTEDENVNKHLREIADIFETGAHEE